MLDDVPVVLDLRQPSGGQPLIAVGERDIQQHTYASKTVFSISETADSSNLADASIAVWQSR